ncbi:MAG: DNA-processing protein DprA [Clostridia bacterium]|nr:DNA-processing protein DprA [Clostridia bacterium]
MKSLECKILKITDEQYPAHLRNIPNAPQRLYYIGDLSIIQKPLYAIVGTRRASPYGRWAAYEIGKRIAQCGISIVSGMAEGIDTCGHRACLDSGTPTVAVLGTGIDVIFPKSNTNLYYEIAENGLILSEYEPGVSGHAYNFPERNRIVSGLSKAVIVVEGAYKSGSMITAKLALEQGRDVFAVPGNINQPNSTGTNSLIYDGAGAITDLNELLPQLGIIGNQLTISLANCSKSELEILRIIKEAPGITVEELAVAIYEDIPTVLRLVNTLELRGLLKSEGAKYFY